MVVPAGDGRPILSQLHTAVRAVEGNVHKPDEVLSYPPYLTTGASWIRRLGQENIPPSHPERARVVLSIMCLESGNRQRQSHWRRPLCPALHACMLRAHNAHNAVRRTLTATFPPFRGLGFPGFRLELCLGALLDSRYEFMALEVKLLDGRSYLRSNSRHRWPQVRPVRRTRQPREKISRSPFQQSQLAHRQFNWEATIFEPSALSEPRFVGRERHAVAVMHARPQQYE